ncbi:MAG: ribosome silencing factor [Comamonadaceae bacterium PBBC2]|nr:MAG: ribosome silencing factor [Comamonadaceae bacterium PBBC2]
MTDTAAKKDIQKLQRAIVDALEDVKAQDLQVFDTEHLSPLFERVVIASGTSNRQTKALAASVRDKVREAGFGKPRIEGEDNGEWIIVDCGSAVAHIMQPTIRTYYNLEEIWGDKPVRLKFGAPKPAAPEAKTPARKAAAKKSAAKTPSAQTSAAKPAAKSKVALKAPVKSAKPAGKTSAKTAAKTPTKTAAKSAAPKAAAKSSTKPTVKTVGKPSPKAAAKTAAAKTPARKALKVPTRRKAD